MNKILNTIKQKSKTIDIIATLQSDISTLSNAVNELKLLQGRQMAIANRSRHSEIIENINEAEFKVYSQWGDDGIIQFLVDYLQIKNKTFIEFGVENYTEANTRFLLINNFWSGLVMDGSERNVAQIKASNIYWQYQLDAECCFITKDNINQLISSYTQATEIGLLVVDVDGNDYWIWEAINNIKPIIVIAEYNGLFGNKRAITVPYKADFQRTNGHYSNLYYGASLKALQLLAESKGYALVACNNNGNNAFFVRKDQLKQLKEISVEQAYKNATFSESRNESGKLTYLNFEEASNLIKGLPVVNILTGHQEAF